MKNLFKNLKIKKIKKNEIEEGKINRSCAKHSAKSIATMLLCPTPNNLKKGFKDLKNTNEIRKTEKLKEKKKLLAELEKEEA